MTRDDIKKPFIKLGMREGKPIINLSQKINAIKVSCVVTWALTPALETMDKFHMATVAEEYLCRARVPRKHATSTKTL